MSENTNENILECLCKLRGLEPMRLMDVVKGKVVDILDTKNSERIKEMESIIDHMYMDIVSFRNPTPHRAPANFAMETHIAGILFSDFADWSKYREEIIYLDGSTYQESPTYNLDETCLCTFGFNIGVTQKENKIIDSINLAHLQCCNFNSPKIKGINLGNIEIEYLGATLTRYLADYCTQISNIYVEPVININRDGDKSEQDVQIRIRKYQEKGFYLQEAIFKCNPNGLIPERMFWVGGNNSAVMTLD